MKITVSPGSLEKLKAKLTLIPVLEGEQLPYKKKGMKGELKKLYLSWEGFRGSEKLLFVGLGKKKELTLERVRQAFGMAAGKVKEVGCEEFSVLSRKLPGLKDREAASAMVEGLLLGSYRFDRYKTKEKDEKKLRGFTLVADKMLEKSVQKTALVCANVNMVRDMVNENADVMTTGKLAAIAKDIARTCKLKLRIMEKPELKRLGMNLLLAVGQGSRYPPRMVVLEYRGNPGSKNLTAIVGKGITFDSGGLNLKPSGYIETMKQDMTGAATVIGIIKTVAELNAPVNIMAVAPLAENMIGPHSYKPGDVCRSFSGKTVEVENTDAEGRLILADALAWTEKHIKPSLIIDIATLTGTSFAVFGERVTAMIGTGDAHKEKLFQAGEKTGERVWELPLYEEYKEDVKGDIGDVTNLGYKKGRYAGTIIGGAFLSHFVKNVPLIHLDIGNTAYRETGEPGYIPKNATGIGVRLLTEFLTDGV